MYSAKKRLYMHLESHEYKRLYTRVVSVLLLQL